MPSFSKILDLCLSLSQELPGVVFIGGVAVYLHAAQEALAGVSPETSHDADFMISFSGYGILKDVEEITYTFRLAKHQMIVGGVEFDIYVERLNRLVVPYDEVFAHLVTIEQVQVACLEHLLVLKLEALSQRGHSAKGDKDRRDIAKIGLLLGRGIKNDLIQPYMRGDLAGLLQGIARSAIFHDLCSHNTQAAREAKAAFASFVADVV